MKDVLNNILIGSLDGVHGHLSPERVLEGLSVAVAGRSIENAPYSIWQQIGHINFWQKRFIAHLKGMKLPDVSTAAEGWPEERAPANEEVLKRAIHFLLESIKEAKDLLLYADKLYHPAGYVNAYEILSAMGSHLSYHTGQIMTLRRILGDYPPPSGGDTW